MKITETQYLGLSCACVEIIRTKHLGMETITYVPKFFLFSDIDSKDQETLRLVTQHFARNGLSFFVYGTKKGYHVISPDLLNLSEWESLKVMIKKFVPNYYRFHIIRISPKYGDDQQCEYFYKWYNNEHKISSQFVKLITERFKDNLQINPNNLADKTYLQITSYTHHELDL